MATSLEPLKGGYDVDENAVRFSNYFHVLRELVHLSCGWLPLEPRLEVKYALGDHLHDDARAVTKIKRRLYELRTPERLPGRARRGARRPAGPRQPRDQLRRVRRDRLRGAQAHARRRDPHPPRHARPDRRRALPAAAHPDPAPPGAPHRRAPARPRRDALAFEDLGALPIRLREVRELQIMPPLDEPARDDYVEVTEEGDTYLTEDLYVNGDENHVPTDPDEQKHFFHGLMDAELCAAELMARNSHEHPEMPWDFHVDMARQCWDEIRHAEVHDRLMATELDCRWGDFPIGFGYFKSIYRLDLLSRLVLFNGTSEQKAMWRHSHRRKVLVELGQTTVARVFDYLLADEVPHVHNGVRWGSHLLGGDEKAYREKVRELRAGLDATGQPVRLERRLGPALAAGLPALRDGLLRAVERLAGEAAELAGGLARGAAGRAEDLLAAALGMAREARHEEREDQDEDAEACDAGDDHVSALPARAGAESRPTRGAARRPAPGVATRIPSPCGGAAASGSTTSPARSHSSAPAATSQCFTPRSK